MAYAMDAAGGGDARRAGRTPAIRRGAAWIEWVMVAPAGLLMLVFLALPFGMAFYLSLTDQRLIPRPIPTKFIGLTNFERILSDPGFWNALSNVTEFVLMVVPVQCGFALAIALVVNQKLPFRNLFRSLFFLPFITSMVVVSVIWSTLFQYPTGPLNQLLSVVSFGLAGPVDWLGNPSTAMPSIVALSAWQAFGFQMVVYLAGLQNISHSLYEAARIDGANAPQRFWHITMPGLRQTHIFVLIITTIQAFKLYTQISLMTHGGPNGATDTVVYYMVSAGFSGQKIGYASAVSVILFVIVVAISLLQRYITRDRT
jgi:multiple sugar transport system permease protein